MSGHVLEARLIEELGAAIRRGLASGELMNPAQISQQAGSFLNRFGPNVLRSLDGEALLQLMHGRQDSDSRCLAYWLEFKDDDEFAGYRFGGIGGGSALKFGIYQRQADNAWMTGPPNAQRVLSLDEAIPMARRQRDELLAGDNVLYGLDVADPSDDAYRRLQAEMEKAAPELSSSSWAHKYWLLAHHDRLDDYHNPRYQRFHLFKLLQTPPDNTGILDGAAPRFVCAGRFVTAARELTVPVTTLTSVLNQRDGGIQRYWRVGTTAGVAGAGESQWSVMRDGHFVSIGWSEQVPDLSAVIGQTNARAQIRGWLIPIYQANPGVATKKASEILNFAQEMAENDVVLACEGQDVLGVGRVRGPYEYDRGLVFPHKRAVQWLLLERWRMGEAEGLLTTVHEIGRSAANLLELERRLFNREPAEPPAPRTPGGDIPATTESLPLLDPFTARVDGILRRKGQVVLYGPPGTGKTYRALGVAKELAARQAFRKSLASLTETEQAEVLGSSNSTEDGPPSGLVRVCTFHPGYGYEDFIEGLRPKTANGQMVFEPQDGIFKRLCSDARGQPDRHFFLVIDEINRGDVPRIFGELITVIELDKRGMRIMLPVAGKSFEVPRNVFLIGTMNTADRSISLLDAALRRRFGFVELMPDSSVLVGRKAGELSLSAWLDALNNRLRKHLKRDARNLQVGHAYLMPSKPITSVTEFARVLRDDIIPLLEEYCYDDFGTLRNILGDSLVDIENQRIREELFTANKEEALILAVSFEEMQPLLLTQETGSDALGAELPEDTSNDGEDSSHSAS